MIYTLKSDFLTVSISDKGAELISVKDSSGFEYMWNYEGDELWGDHAPILFPICGRLFGGAYTVGGVEYKMNMHGFTRHKTIKVTESSDTKITFLLTEDEDTLAQYPFKFALTICYELRGSELTLSFKVENNSDRVMPYMLGWHPGFNLDTRGGAKINDFSLEFTEGDVLSHYPIYPNGHIAGDGFDYKISDKRYYLNEKEIYDIDTMIFSGMGNAAYLSAEKAEKSIRISWSENIPFLCIWKEPTSDAEFICVEPWTDLPTCGRVEENFDEKKLSRLGVGESAKYVYKVDFS
jgi:galactose mutarotase-like enzyme